MMYRTLGLALACATGIALASAAKAGDLLVLDDAALDGVTAAGAVAFDTAITKTVDIDVAIDFLKNAEVNSTVDIDDKLATAEASADAIDYDDVLAETETFAQVSSLGAFAFSQSVAAASVPAADNGVTPTP
jgi:hypothetical protein